jgi:hypothetical protein
MDAQLGDGDAVQRGIQLAVPHPGQTMALPGPGRAFQRRHAGVHGQGRLGAEPAHPGDLSDDLGRGQHPTPRQAQQPRAHPGHPVAQLGLELIRPQGQLPAARDQLPDDADLDRVRQVGQPGLELVQDPPLLQMPGR